VRFMVDDNSTGAGLLSSFVDLHCSLSFPDDFIGNEENGV
jgi:hypothetical protein